MWNIPYNGLSVILNARTDELMADAYHFCVSCEQQVKCLNLECGDYLLKSKSKCLSCGTLVNTPQPGSTSMNTFSLQEEQSENHYSRKVNLSFTDTSIDKVASVIRVSASNFVAKVTDYFPQL